MQHIDNGVQDSFEHYNSTLFAVRLLLRADVYMPFLLVHHTVNDGRKHPVALRPFLPEIRAFNEYNHFHILYPILKYAHTPHDIARFL